MKKKNTKNDERLTFYPELWVRQRVIDLASKENRPIANMLEVLVILGIQEREKVSFYDLPQDVGSIAK